VNDPDPRDPYAPPPSKQKAPPKGAPAGGDGRENGDRRQGWFRERPAEAPTGGPGRPNDEHARRAMIAGRIALATGVSGLALSVYPSVGLVLDAVAIVIAVRARQIARAHGVAAPGAITGAVLGLAGLLLVTTALAVLWDESRAYDDCMGGANTKIAKDNCREQFLDQIEERFGIRP
jgi:hypothetical protein